MVQPQKPIKHSGTHDQGSGGSSDNMFLPIPSGFKYRKLGLYGGAPIHGFSRGAKRLPTQTAVPSSSASSSSSATSSSSGHQSQQHTNSSPAMIVTRNEQGIINCCYPNDIQMEDIVVIDSSPDEKQRIMDYDEDNDKSVVGTEVSLSSVAQNVGDVDEVSVMYDHGEMTGNDFGIGSSPLESEGVDEYQLFPCVADYVDDEQRQHIDEEKLDVIIEDDSKSITIDSSDEDGRMLKNPESPEYLDDLVNIDTTNSEEHFTTTEEEIMSMDSEIIISDSGMKASPEEQMHATAEDFEAMIDSGNSKDSKESNSSTEMMTNDGDELRDNVATITPTTAKTIKMATASKERTVITVVMPKGTSTMTSAVVKPQIVSYSRRPITATAIVTSKSGVPIYSTAAAAAAGAHNLVKDAQSAKYLLGNTTISVPILKNAIPLARGSGGGNGGGGHSENSSKKMMSQSLMGHSLTGKKINTSNFVTLSPLNITHTSSGRIVQAALLRPTSQQQQSLSVHQKKLSAGITEPTVAKTMVQPSLSYTKLTSLSSLKVTQDVSLPTKIFEDESISPDSSIEQDEHDIMSDDAIYPIPVDENHHLLAATQSLDANESGGSDLPTINEQLTNNYSTICGQFADSKSASSSPIVRSDSQSNSSSIGAASIDTLNSSKSIDAKQQQKLAGAAGVIPVHVIIKSRETSQSPVLSAPPNNSRLTSIIPQLSPLSQPNEIQTNMANASQQLRSIMSSINQTKPSDTTTVAHRSQTEITASKPNETANSVSDQIIATSEQTMNSMFRTRPATSGIASTASSQIISGGSVLTVLSKDTTDYASATAAARHARSQSTTITGNSLIIAQNKIPILSKIQMENAAKANTTITASTVSSIESPIMIAKTSTMSILSSTLSQPQQTRIVPYNNESHYINASARKPPALLVTTRQSMSSTMPSPISSNSSASSTAAIQNILQSSLQCQPLSGSILSATLSQPPTSQKSSANSNTLLHSQLTSTSLTNFPFRYNFRIFEYICIIRIYFEFFIFLDCRRSKSTEEMPGFTKEPTASQLIAKRHSSVESSGVSKEEKSTVFEDASANSNSSSQQSKDVSNEMSINDNCKMSSITIVPHTKSDDSQNVLLKQLLQNSGTNSSPSQSQLPTSVSRAVTSSVRAPSLGVVSSLEAQLARPVIPPVPAQTNAIQTKTILTTNASTENSMRPHHQVLSRETSFISKAAAQQSTHDATFLPEIRNGSKQFVIVRNSSNTATSVSELENRPMQNSPQRKLSTTHDFHRTMEEAASLAGRQTPSGVKITVSSHNQLDDTAAGRQTPNKQTIDASTPMPTTTHVTNKMLVNSKPSLASPTITSLSKASATPPAVLLQSQTSSPTPPPPMPTPIIKKEEIIASSTTSAIIAASTQHHSSPKHSRNDSPSGQQQQVQPPSRPPSSLPTEVKRELLDDNSQMSATSDQSIIKQEQLTIKDEFGSTTSSSQNESIVNDPETAAKIAQETALEIKRRKRREYQKNRRQMQTQNKESAAANSGSGAAGAGGVAKKKVRKSSATTKVEEDYDTFIDNLMVQLKLMPPMQILEPVLSRNHCICPAFGAGDMTKCSTEREYNIVSGDLKGDYGSAELPNIPDHYNTKPFGCKSPLTEQQNTSTHYGFYDQEFSPIKFHNDDDHRSKYDFLKDREIETPDTIISSSSPECVVQESPSNFPGLRLIQEDDDESHEIKLCKRMSPQIPIIAPIPIRLEKGMSLTADDSLSGDNRIKPAHVKDMFGTKSRFGPPIPVKDKNNVTITLTLTSSAADDILTVLQDLANILHIPQPTTYQIVERTTTPPSQKLGLYRTRGKDGKEGAPIDIQTILNGNAKFCRHCDVVILNTIIRAKAYEFPLLALNNNNSSTNNNNTTTTANELMNESDDLYFCSKLCYKQFQCVPTNILDDNKAASADVNEESSNSTYDDTVKYSQPNANANVLLTNTTTTTPSPMVIDSVQASTGGAAIKMDTTDGEGGKSWDANSLDGQTDIKVEISNENSNEASGGSKSRKLDTESGVQASKKPKPMQYLRFGANCFRSPGKYKKMSEKDVTEMLFRLNITVTPQPKMPEDTRQCIFCHQIGDGVADGPSRLLNYDVDKWVHLNCALWSDGVYETVNGALMHMENALQMSFVQQCTLCNQLGATIKCFKNRCANIYHLSCAIKDDCVFYKSKTTHCAAHALKTEKDNELTTLSVQRRVYVERDEGRQVASVMHHSELSNLLRVGSLIFLNVGQLLPHQLQNFHTPNFIYPIGYKIIRFYWSMRRPNKRCRYICSIADVSGRPEFRVLVQEPFEEDIELRDATPKAIWQRILDRLAELRKEHNLVQIFPKFIIGEDLFGLTEPAVVRILESLPGIETLTDYRFKYGRNPLLELPLAINPSGAARTEPKPQQNLSWKKPHTQRSGSASQRPAFVASTSVAGEVACPYSKQFVHSKSSQYKKMKQEWRNNVFLARSKIQGLGLYAARDLEKHTMVIEYIGEVIRSELSELREKQYEAKVS